MSGTFLTLYSLFVAMHAKLAIAKTVKRELFI